MRTTLACVGMGAAMLFFWGCDALLGILPPERVLVTLRNAGDFDVDVEVFVGDEQLIPEDLLTEIEDPLTFRLAPGEATTFTRDCDDLQAILVDADLSLIGEIGPGADTGVLRDGDDFGCRDSLIFTFDHSALIVDFDVSVRVEP